MPNPNSAALIPALAFVLLLLWIGMAQARLAWGILKGRPLWPEPAPTPVVWNERGVFGVLMLFVALQVVAALAVPRTEGERLSPRLLMVATGLMNFATLLLGPWVLAKTARRPLGEVDLLGPNPGAWFWTGVNSWPTLAPWIYGAFFLAIQVWGITKHPVEEWVRGDRSPTTILLASVMAIVAAPAAEEFLYRGVLLGWLTKLCLRRPSLEEGLEWDASIQKPRPFAAFWTANVLVSIVFAGMHGPVWPSPVPLFLLSLALGALYQRTGGIAAPIGLHMVFNGIAMTMMNLSLMLPQQDAKPEPPVPPPASSYLHSLTRHRLQENHADSDFRVGEDRGN